jgi:serine/threonine protein kinase
MPPSSSSAPKEWPQVVKDTYEPVRVLGKGGFACVTLAKPKNPSAAGINHPPLVAMKIVDGTSDARAYAHREVDILRELNHPNIMKVIDSWEPNKFEPAVIALSYSKGPTVLALLKHGGSLSSLFSRVVNAQLVDAISYLHGHAVVHRDIKPDSKSFLMIHS